MGFVLTLLYILTAYLSPGILFGPLAQYHLEIIIAALALLASLPSLPGSGILRAPQTIAIAGMAFAIVASLVLTGWIGGAPEALYEFLPDSFAFFLVALNCRTRRRLQMVVLTLVAGSYFYIVQGALALQAGAVVSPYLYDQGYEGNHILRLRGLSIVNDPNDFAQVLVSLIPCMFLFWKPKKLFWNVLSVVLPVCILFVGVYLTHSRGSLLALMAVIGLSVYRKFGLIPAGVMAGATFALSTVWSGGRDISVEAGADRMDAWATGLELIKSHPIFGVGYRRFTEYNPITAHNTIVVCAAELGFVGFFFWVLFVVSSVREGVLLRARSPKKAGSDARAVSLSYAPAAMRYQIAAGFGADPMMMSPSSHPSVLLETAPSAASSTPFAIEERPATRESDAGIRQMAWLMVVCFAGFLVAGWFLSRAYVMWLFVYGGMARVVYRMAEERGIAPPPISWPRLLRIAFLVSIALLLLVYVILRAKRFFPG